MVLSCFTCTRHRDTTTSKPIISIDREAHISFMCKKYQFFMKFQLITRLSYIFANKNALLIQTNVRVCKIFLWCVPLSFLLIHMETYGKLMTIHVCTNTRSITSGLKWIIIMQFFYHRQHLQHLWMWMNKSTLKTKVIFNRGKCVVEYE